MVQIDDVPCPRCETKKNMVHLDTVTTDFGGSVDVLVCRRCGQAAIVTTGERPAGY